MNDQITQLVIIAVAIVPFTNALVAVVRNAVPVLSSKYVPLASLAIGAAVGLVASLLPGVGYSLLQLTIAGAISGLAACGVYDISYIEKGGSQGNASSNEPPKN